MSNTIAYVDNQTLTNIADAIRDKTETNGKMLLSDIPDKIRNLDTSDITALDIRVTAVEDALAGMTFVGFSMNNAGHVLITNSDRLGTTSFALTSNGHMEVTY